MKIAVCVFLIAQARKLLIKEVIIQGHLNDKVHFFFPYLCSRLLGLTFIFSAELVCLEAKREKKC